MSIHSVALLGADGKLGPSVLSALASSNQFKTITVLKRASSTSSDTSYPPNVTVSRIPDAALSSPDQLTPLLRALSLDAIIVTTAGSQTALQHTLATAAAAAGIKRFIPADFGSCDSQSAYACDLVPLYAEKTKTRQTLQHLSEQHPQFSWTALVTGHFFDWDTGFLHVNVRERHIDILDEGTQRWSTSTLAQIGRATVQVLTHAEQTRNKLLYVQSFCVTQMEVVEAYKRVTAGEKEEGGKEWTVKKVDSKSFVEHEKKKRDQGDTEAIEELVWVLGTVEADWTAKEDFAMELLDLEEERLDEVVVRIVSENK